MTLTAIKDNTLYEDSSGSLSNGSGDHLFAGMTRKGEIRRALVAFDLTGEIPAGATITKVELTLNMSRTQAGPQAVTLHRALADWGEGDSDAQGREGAGGPAMEGDATWIYRQFDSETWSSPGGDFVEEPSASAQLAAEKPYVWGSTAELVADVQGWVGDPSTNFGWLIKGNEGANQTAKRFDSREASFKPKLVVEFTPPG